jgi:hypothetical protein
MNKITIANVTRKDFQGKQIRILSAQKVLFPEERCGFPQTYDVRIIWKGNAYGCVYRIGSKDGKSRSGILRLQNGLAEAMGKSVGKLLELERIGNMQYKLKPV